MSRISREEAEKRAESLELHPEIMDGIDNMRRGNRMKITSHSAKAQANDSFDRWFIHT
jgi:hypothetical protein